MAAEGGGGFSWRSLQVWASVPVLLVSLFIGLAFFPPFLVVAVFLILGMVLSRRPGRAGTILLLIGAVLTILSNLLDPAGVQPFLHLESAQDFVPKLLGFGGALVALIAGVVALKKKGVASTAARSVGALTLVAAIVLIGASAYATATFESEPSRSGDAQLATKEFEFRPNMLQAEGPNVRLFFDNSDPSLHTFTIDALGVDLAVPPGKSRRIEFSANPGTYDFYCKPHPDMKGKVTIS